LALPHSDLPFILETDALYYCWATILLQKHGKKEEVCAYASGTFLEAEKNYPSSQEILAVKKDIKKFRLFLKSVHFIVKRDLRYMKGMLQNKRLLEQGNSRVLRWALWLDGYDFDIIYKVGKENYLVDLMTREGAIIQTEYAVKKFEFGECSSSSQNNSQVTLCSSCHYSFCVDCLLEKVLSLPKIILEKWFWLSDTRHNYEIPLAPINNNRAYFGAVRYPYHKLVYIYDPNMRWIDYYAII